MFDDMFDEKCLDEELENDYYEISEPKNGGIKEWFKERKERRLAKKQQKEELHNRGIYSKGEYIRSTISTLAFGSLMLAAAGCIGFTLVTSLSISLLIPTVRVIACLGVLYISNKMLKYSMDKKKEIREARKEMKSRKEKKNTKEKKNKKSKTKKPNLFKRIKNKLSQDKSKNNPTVDFSELETIEPEVIKSDSVANEKETKKKEDFKSNDILNVKLSREYKNVKLKESNISFIQGIGVYIYPVAKENKKEQKFFEAGYEAVYEEKPMSMETETHKVYMFKKF